MEKSLKTCIEIQNFIDIVKEEDGTFSIYDCSPELDERFDLLTRGSEEEVKDFIQKQCMKHIEAQIEAEIHSKYLK